MLEVGGVERARRPHHHGGGLLGARGRDLGQRAAQQRGVVVDGADAVGREQPGEQARHRHAVLQHVGDAARRADVVLQHLPAAVAVAHEVAAGDVAVHAPGRPDPVRGAGEGRARDDQLPRHDARVDDLARVVDVVDERVQRADALGQAALDRAPLVRRDDPRDEVERERAVAHRAVGVRSPRIERDALLHEDGVAHAAGVRERLGPELGERGGERQRVIARTARRGEHLVVAALHRPHVHRPGVRRVAPRCRPGCRGTSPVGR